MRAARYGGPNGKARRQRHRRRAERVFEQQMLEEFFEGHRYGPVRDRFIPIRGRSEFLPTASAVETMNRTQSHQLELPLSPATDQSPSGRSSQQRDAGNPDRGHASGRTSGPGTQQTSAPGKAPIRFPRAGDNGHLPLKPPKLLIGRRHRRFTLGGFLSGCAIGGAAAATLLLAIRAISG